MTREITIIQKFNAIKRVLENHSSTFDGKPNAIAFRDRFYSKSLELSNRLNNLVRPVNSFYAERKSQRENLQNQLRRMTEFGIMLAKGTQNSAMLAAFTRYKKMINTTSAKMMLQVAHDELSLINSQMAAAQALGLDSSFMDGFEEMLTGYQQAFNTTQNQLDVRRAERDAVNTLIKECNTILRFELDQFVRFNAPENQVLAKNFQRLRRVKRASSKSGNNMTSDITGTVSDTTTGLPVAGALVKIIEQGWSVTTDADGDFLFDELPAGHITLSCHAPGYEVPEIASFELGLNDHVVWNFQLSKLASGS
jgi:hypothetical protein